MNGRAANERIGRDRCRRRRVKFGNPALGTYGGEVRTLDYDDSSQSDDENDTSEEGSAVSSLSERANLPLPHRSTDNDNNVDESWKGRLVAMIEVPPEQVPEGVLNLVRGHRPYIEHVRIVITSDGAEVRSDRMSSQNSSPDGVANAPGRPMMPNATAPLVENLLKSPPSPLPMSQSLGSSHASDSDTFPLFRCSQSVSSSPRGDGIAGAASILATDDATETAKMNSIQNSLERQEALERLERQADEEQAMTYLILFLLCTSDAADDFVRFINGKPYTSLEEDVVCSVRHVVSIEGDGGVSLISPFFASTTTERGSNLVPSSLPRTASAMTVAAATSAGGVGESHNCAVCLESLDVIPSRPGSDTATVAAVASASGNSSTSTSTAIITTVCNHTFHIDCLLQWQDSPCPVCRYDHSGLNEALSQCHVCGTTQNNYVCLICGVVSCGGEDNNRPHAVAAAAAIDHEDHHSDTNCHGNSGQTAGNGRMALAQPPAGEITGGHARDHYNETLHAYALNTETQHVWDFAGQGYVHRLIQNKDDMKIVEIADPSNTTSQERTLSPGPTDAQEGEAVHRKLEGFASQYYTLLKSQLEQQRIYYEGRLEEIRREHRHRRRGSTGTSSKCFGGTTADHIAALKSERSQLEARCNTLRRRYLKVADDAAFLKDMNESLESNKNPIRKEITDAQRRRADMKKMMVACLPPLEEKVNLLMIQLEAVSNTAHNDSDDGPNGNKKPAARR